MSFGSRFRTSSETTSFKTTVGAALVGVALLGGTFGAVVAQDASPEASPMASPVAVADWISDVAIADDVVVDGDTSTVTVKVEDPLSISPATFETRPFVQMQTANNLDTGAVVVVLTAPEAFDATGFTLPEDVADLPEGVTPYGSFEVAAGEQLTAIFPALPEGTYVLASTDGQAVTFVVTPAAELDVPDIFAEPEGTPAS